MPRQADVVSQSQRLANLTERNLHRLIETEFSLITSFCDIAESEVRLQHRERAQGLLQKAVLTAKAIRHISRRQLPNAKPLEVHSRVDELENRLSALARELRNGSD